MSERLPQPSLIPVSDSGDGRYVLEKEYCYRWQAAGGIWLLRIPAGFPCDGASVPWAGTVLTGIGRDGLHRAGALVHDFLYRHGGRPPEGSFYKFNFYAADWRSCAAPWTREQADKLFANMLGQAGVSPRRRRLMYLAVRLFGWRSWKGNAI